MHIPKSFEISDTEDIHDQIDQIDLATLVSVTENGLLSTPLPMYFLRSEGTYGTLYGHIARGNKQNKLFSNPDALVIFQGPSQYVSPSWYPSKPQNGKVVPTWNYVAIHAHGPLELLNDPKDILEIVDKLTEKHEPKFSKWTTDEAPRSISTC